MADQFSVTDKTKITRLPKRGSYDKATVYSILDEALYCNLAFALDQQPFQVPTGFVRINDRLYVHGSVGSGFLECKLSADVVISGTRTWEGDSFVQRVEVAVTNIRTAQAGSVFVSHDQSLLELGTTNHAPVRIALGLDQLLAFEDRTDTGCDAFGSDDQIGGL
jgi:hypothetical protein